MNKRLIMIPMYLALLLFAACGPRQSAEPTSQPYPTVRAQPVGAAVRVGVLAIRSAEAANAQYGGIIAYLEEQVGLPFILVPVTQESQFELVESRKLDFTFNNPLAAVQIQRLYDTEFVATLSRVNTGVFFGGLIIVRADGGIESIGDLRGANATCVDFVTAAAGCIFQVFHLKQQGFDPFSDFAKFSETPSQDNIVLGVLNGTFDAGFIRTGQIEDMIAEGTLLSMDGIHIIDQADDDFFYPHTTALYPEWPFAALKETDPELVAAVRDALLNLPSDHPALASIGADGFVADVDYSQLHELVEMLQLLSWDADVEAQ